MVTANMSPPPIAVSSDTTETPAISATETIGTTSKSCVESTISVANVEPPNSRIFEAQMTTTVIITDYNQVHIGCDTPIMIGSLVLAKANVNDGVSVARVGTVIEDRKLRPRARYLRVKVPGCDDQDHSVTSLFLVVNK
jgi:hypothetical protein